MKTPFRWILGITLASLLLRAAPAHAYPELLRYGYANCTSCHVSPSGGGTLTPYGRQLSREVLSTWGAEGEEKPAYFINSPDFLDLGGDYRSVYEYQSTPRVNQGTYQFMQLDLEAAVNYGRFTFDAALGYQDPLHPENYKDYLLSRTHYVTYHFTDEIAVRGGRFYPDYGIMTPNHELLIRDSLDIHQPEPLGDGETYNIEASYLGNPYNLIVTGIFGRPDETAVQKQDGFSIVGSRMVSDTSKVGLSYMYGTDDFLRRSVFGPFATIGISEQFYVLTEVDFQAETPKTSPGYNPVQWGYAETTRFGYMPLQGLNLVADQEYGRLNFASPLTLQQRYGGGVWWWPRPHLAASFEYQRRQDPGLGFEDFYDFMYFLWHIYI